MDFLSWYRNAICKHPLSKIIENTPISDWTIEVDMFGVVKKSRTISSKKKCKFCNKIYLVNGTETVRLPDADDESWKSETKLY